MAAERGGPVRILCAGNLVLDEVFRLDEFPPPDGKVEADEYITVGGGNAANAAIAITRLGGKVTYAGPLGSDEIGDRILANLAREGVDCSGCVRVPGARSQVSAIFVNARGDRSIATYKDTGLTAGRPRNPEALVANADGVLIDNRVPEFVRPIAEAAMRRGVPLVLDADKQTRPDDPLLQLANYVIFSSECLRLTTGMSDLVAALIQIQRVTGRFVAVTDGPNDVRWSDGGAVQVSPVFKVDVVDTLAAGDIFHGGFALAVVEGQPIAAALRLAAATAGLKCTRFGGGATAPTRAEVEEFLRRN